MKLTQDRLKELLAYNPETGVFTWKVKSAVRVKIGDVAGCSEKRGRISIRVDGEKFLAHRLAWFYVHGVWPSTELDHINVNPSDNRIANLRVASRAQNAANTKRSRANTSGIKGVCFDASRGKWLAQIGHQGNHKNLGRFSRKEDAANAYAKAASEMKGQFARTDYGRLDA